MLTSQEIINNTEPKAYTVVRLCKENLEDVDSNNSEWNRIVDIIETKKSLIPIQEKQNLLNELENLLKMYEGKIGIAEM